MENLQVYRYRLAGQPVEIQLERDLERGRGQRAPAQDQRDRGDGFEFPRRQRAAERHAGRS